MAESAKSKSYVVPVLVVLLVVASFAIGTMWQRLQSLESAKGTGGTGGDSGTDNVAAAAVPPAGTPNHDPLTLAEELGHDRAALESCMNDASTKALVDEDYNSGLAAGVNGTPGNIVMHSSGAIVLVPGAIPYAQITALVDDLLDDGSSDQASEITVAPVTDNDHILGAANAPITWIEYSDLECPFCARIHPDLKRLLTEYDGQVRWVYRHFPLAQLHPDAEGLAAVSECIAQSDGEDAFWQYVDHVYANQ